MTDQTPDLAALEALAEAATPGPWSVCEWDRQTVMPTPWAEDRLAVKSRGRFAAISPAGDRYEWRAADAAFIAAANPVTVLWLIREVKRLESDLYDACAVIDDARHALSPERPGPRVEPAKRVLCGETAHRLVSAWVDQRRRALDPIPPHVRHHQRALDGGE